MPVQFIAMYKLATLIVPVQLGIFLPESAFSADSLTVSVHPVCNHMYLQLFAH